MKKNSVETKDEIIDDALPLSERAYRSLLDSIQQGTVKPGERMREVELANSLGISRTPIREALGRLINEGLLVNDPVKGLIIAELDHSEVNELYAMREVLEGTAARFAAQHASDVEISILFELVERDRGLAIDQPQSLAANNRLFHDTLYRAAHNRYLVKTLNTLRETMALLGQTTLAKQGRSDKAIEEHLAIVNAIKCRDANAAEIAAREHIRAAHRTRLKLMFDPLP
jgi:DNA-binding GntR family transcriptional regulator